MHHYSEALRKGLVRRGHTGYRKKSFANKASLQVNQPLGLTFYCSDMAFKTRAAHLVDTASVAAVLVISVAGCSNIGLRDTAGSVGSATATPTTQAEWRSSLDSLGARYRENPNDADAAIAYARALRANEQRAQAVAVLEQASIRNPRNTALLGAFGRALAEVGQHKQALEAPDRAHTPDNPDWRILNVQGAVLDQLGRHPEAQRHYASALKFVPDEPAVLSNLGLSYMLTKDLKNAEITLRRAVAQPNACPQVRQNLALVFGLRGRFEEAEKIARPDLPENEAAANVNYLRQMLAQQRDLKKMGRAYATQSDIGS
jgi:Flp pilus assembly protein TadD